MFPSQTHEDSNLPRLYMIESSAGSQISEGY